jgi:density-regulated protein
MIDDNSNDVHTETGEDDTTTKAKEVIYCAICTFPPEVSSPLLYTSTNHEYCEFGGSLTKCKAWLNSEHPSLFNKLYSVGPFPSPSPQI